MTNPIRIFWAIGNLSRSRASLLKSEGVKRILISFADFHGRDDILNLVKPFSEILIDSGGFSHGNSKAPISLDAYAFFLQTMPGVLKDRLTGYFNLDDMADHEKTLLNQRKLEDQGLTPVPVYHYGESGDVLDHYAKHYEYVGIGGLAVGQMRTQDLKIFWDKIALSYPDTRFHILGSMQLRAFTDNQPWSIDGTSWLGDLWGNLIGIENDNGPTLRGITMPLGVDGELTKSSLRSTSIKKKDLPGHFFSTDELRRHNTRALLHFQDMLWVNQEFEAEQGQLL
jgi:hypothetical protein